MVWQENFSSCTIFKPFETMEIKFNYNKLYVNNFNILTMHDMT